MESGYILVEIDCKEVDISSTSIDCSRIVLQDIVEIGSGFCRNGPDLLVAASIPRYKKNRNSFDLFDSPSVLSGPLAVIAYLSILIYHPFSVQINRIFACKTSMFRIEVGELRKRRSHI